MPRQPASQAAHDQPKKNTLSLSRFKETFQIKAYEIGLPCAGRQFHQEAPFPQFTDGQGPSWPLFDKA